MVSEANQRVLITCGRLIDGTGGPSVRNGAILIEGKKILAVGESGEIKKRPEANGAQLIDAPTSTILPGLIDAHVHVAWGPQKDPAWWKIMSSRERLTAWTINAAQVSLRAGITTLRDCGAPEGITLHVREAIQNGYTVGPRLEVCGPAITTTAGHGGTWIGAPADSVDELRKTIRELCRDGVDFIKIMATGGSSDPETNRRREQYSLEEMQAAVYDAHRLQRVVVAHVNATEGIRNSVYAGVDILAHCNWLGEKDGTLDYDRTVVKEMATRGTYVDLNVDGGFRPFATGDAWAEDFGQDGPTNRWELMQDMRDEGIQIFFTSDYFGPEIAKFPRLLVDAAQKTGMSAEELVWRATGLPAKASQLDDTIGTLKPGLEADLLCVEGDITDDVQHLLNVNMVFSAGEKIVDHGLFHQTRQAVAIGA